MGNKNTKSTMGGSNSSNRRSERNLPKLGIDSNSEKKKPTKLLLFGIEGSGKSTMLKQMRIIHGDAFRPEEIEECRMLIQKSLMEQMGTVLGALKVTENGANLFEQTRIRYAAEHVNGVIAQSDLHGYNPQTYFSLMTINALHQLWANPTIQTMVSDRGQQLGLNENAKYFFDNIDRITEENYRPTKQDILYCRKPTKGIVEVPLKISGISILVLDVGGQKTERRKWLHYFDDVTAVLFLVSLSDFDREKTEEVEDDDSGAGTSKSATTTNCLLEALAVFEQICNAKEFERSSIVLFMNKRDLFVEKVNAGADIRRAFPDYRGSIGPGSHNQQADYVIDQFLAKNKNPQRYIYTEQGKHIKGG